MPKGQRKYNGTQKVEIIKRSHRENLSFKGASREYGISDRTLRDWERIYWEEGEEALLLERRGRACAASGTEELPALGHQWSGWMPVQGDGSREYRICAVCGAVEYRDVSHNSGSSDSTISTGLRVLDPAQTDILQNAQLVRLSQISDVLYIDVTHETASLQGVLSDLTGLRSENIETVVFSTERCTSTLSLSDVAALGAGDTPFTLRHSGSTATFTVGGADHSALLR